MNMNEPFTQPISTLIELFEWHGINLPYSRIVPWSRKLAENYPKTLICHDMAGGYLDDRFCQGLACYNGYQFNYWPYIDGFIYFSHHLVTIPPSTWVNCAHLNGVPIYGTFITEGDEGNQVCCQIFASKEVCKAIANILINITLFYHFDGWLLNIENSIETRNIEIVKYFIDYLTKELHKKLPDSLVLWYDSVTVDGELKWQNELNHKNIPFYLNCDGIFLNYTWQEKNLINSVYNKKMSDDYKRDIYVGIDVFGRGMIGDGGFDTKVAMELVRRHNLSVAIFAPAWTYEKFKPEERTDVDLKFWLSISPFLYPCNQRFSKLPIRYNHFKRTFYLREDKNSNSSSEESGKFISEVEVPSRYLTNLGCQTRLPLLLPPPGANYTATNCVDSIIYSKQFDDPSYESCEISVPLYVLSVNLFPSQVASIAADFVIAAFDFESSDTSPHIYSLGIKYKILKPLQDGLLNEGVEYQLEIPFMPELVGVKNLRHLSQRYLNFKIVSRTTLNIDANRVIHNREMLKGGEKLCTLKLTVTIEAYEETLSGANINDYGSERKTYEIREVYVKISGPNQGSNHFMFALNYFEMKLYVLPHTEIALTEKNYCESSISSHLEKPQFWDIFIREYEFCEGSLLKLHLSWVATNSLSRRIHNVSFTKDGGFLNCLTDEPNLDKLKCIEGKDNSYEECRYFAIFKKIFYQYQHQAEEKNLIAGDWSFVGLTANHSYYFTSNTLALSRPSKDLFPKSMIILLHPLRHETRNDSDRDLRELVELAHSATIELLFTNDY